MLLGQRRALNSGRPWPPPDTRSGRERIICVVLVMHDVTREQQYVAKLSYQASHDALTA